MKKGVPLCVGPAVQSARFGELAMRQNGSKPLSRATVLVVDACRKRVKVEFRDRRSSLEDSEFVEAYFA